jgi:hypothetical protein
LSAQEAKELRIFSILFLKIMHALLAFQRFFVSLQLFGLIIKKDEENLIAICHYSRAHGLY